MRIQLSDHFSYTKLLRYSLPSNGSSELMTSISSSIVGVLCNLQLMRLAGENGIAAYGVILYVNYIFISGFGNDSAADILWPRRNLACGSGRRSDGTGLGGILFYSEEETVSLCIVKLRFYL